MKKLNNNELSEINGGWSITATILTVLGVTFLLGVLDGIVNPSECN